MIQAFQNGSKEEIDNIITSNSHLIKLSKNQGSLGPNDLHILHVAVQVAPLDTIRHLITTYKGTPAFDINATEPQNGNTPLHVAAMYGRADVVMYLLSFDDIINDTMTNSQGKQPVEVARTPELAEAMQVVRAQYVEKVATQMKQCFLKSNIPGLDELLSNPRAAALLDINGQDPDTGSTVLHDFVRSRNVAMIEFILSHGGDPLRRNSKGVLPIDLTKDDNIRKILKKSTKSQQVILQSAGMSPMAMKNRNQLTTAQSGESKSSLVEDNSDHPSLLGPPPSMKGFLKKWTNFTGGYKLRWFVLENGVLSYYKRQNDTESACRGSINMRQARLHVDSTEKLQFEVLSSTSVKFHLKANHPVETGRWVWALTNAIQYAKDEDKIRNLQQTHRRYQSSPSNVVKVIDSGSSGNEALNPPAMPSTQFSTISPSVSNNTTSGSVHSSTVKAHRTTSSISASYQRPLTNGPPGSRPQSMINDEAAHNNNVARLVQMNNTEIGRRGNFDRDEDDDEEEEEEDYMNRDEPPFTPEIQSAEDSINVGLRSVEMLLESLTTSLNSGSLSPDELKKGFTGLEQAISMIGSLTSQYTHHVSSRERFFQTKIERSNQLQELWTKSISDLEAEKSTIQEQLHKAIQKKRQANKVLREVAGSPISGSTRTSLVYPNRRGSTTGGDVRSTLIEEEALKPVNDEQLDADGLSDRLQQVEIESESESELEDQFFDALGSGDEGYIEEPQPPNAISTYGKYDLRVSHPPPLGPDLNAFQVQAPQQQIFPTQSSAAQAALAQPTSPAPPIPLGQDQPLQVQGAQSPLTPSISVSPPFSQSIQQTPTDSNQQVQASYTSHQEHLIPRAVSGPQDGLTSNSFESTEIADSGTAVAAGAATAKLTGYPEVEKGEKDFLEPLAQEQLKKPQTSSKPSSILEQGPHDDLTNSQRVKLDTIVNNDSFAGYEDGPRKRLTLDNDNRPKISLWGVLKNLIGKDMTRMTLPVSFNECTNLLQRSAEDMEYTNLLDKAASIVDDPGERMAYIAAFAASSYSSTINRIAKPFNPLLGETFEYARPDMGYRMFSEQVSHHPPIGALVAESPRWDFYGASNVKSKFTGRSFDINPLGLWYITLRPNNGSGIEEEVYSFRKVTSSVVGIITGSPVVDNYGDMEITNYTLGYKCLLKFKARGWRGDGAFEVRGTVYNKEEVPQWIVGGRWNDRIFGKKVGGDEAQQITNGKQGDLGEKSSRVLLWKVHERNPAPFNLTQFAITLNALPEKLGAWLPQSDTRFRPDQRAMEEGRYDDASEDKHRVEEKQRAKKREREASGEEYNPRWFSKKIHPLSGQEYWSYDGQYWEQRMSHGWKGVPDLY